MEKCCRDGQYTDDNMIWRLRFARWITKATATRSEYVILSKIEKNEMGGAYGAYGGGERGVQGSGGET